MRSRTLLAIAIIALCGAEAWADCVTLDVTAWDKSERAVLGSVATTAVGQSVAVQYQIAERIVDLCSAVAMGGLTSAGLQVSAQAYLVARQNAEVARQAALDAARTEVETNDFCTATFTEVDARIDTLVNTQRDAIQVAINATNDIGTAQTAMTSMNTRYATVFKQSLKKLSKCVRGRAALRGE